MTVLAERVDDLGTGADGDLGVLLDLLDQVVDIEASSDGPRTSSVTDFAVAGHEHRGLAGRVRAADDVDVLVLALRGVGHRRAVVDARGRRSCTAGSSGSSQHPVTCSWR